MPGKCKHAVTLNYRAGKIVRAVALATILGSASLPARAQQESADLTARSLEDLMNIEVTSVSKIKQTLSRTAAAIFVISAEDILRSGARNIPDLLRMVPGMDVAQINASTWAISARGFNGRFSNVLLVLVDGRPVYTQTFGGVFWDVLDLPFVDIERIEVIRGPGGSIWGANAVNGVVNIITKKASETPGGVVLGGGGNLDQGFGAIQYGGSAGDSTDYRVYTKYFNQDHLPNSASQDGGDGWHLLQGGFRTDSVLSSKDTLTVEGNVYDAREGIPTTDFPSVTSPAPQNIEQLANQTGGFVQGVWDHTLSTDSDTTLRVSYDRYEYNDIIREHRSTLGLDFQHHFSRWSRQNIVWGLTYVYSPWNSDGNLTASFVPSKLNTQLFSSFVQDEIAIVPDRFYLSIGAKLEHNYYTGFDFMPSARVTWALSAHHTLWAAVSQAERTPSAIDASARYTLSAFPGPGGIPVLVTFIGNPQVKDEGLIAYEMGYRTSVRRTLSMDFTAYYNNYSDQYTREPLAPFLDNVPPPTHFILPITYENLMHGETEGIEVAVNWQPTPRWTLSPGYAFEEIHMHLAPASHDTTSVAATEGSSPDHSAQLRSHFVFTHALSWDTSAYFIGRLTDPSEPSYARLDTQLSWLVGKGVSLSFVGQNLLRDLHEEFVDSTNTARSTQVKRSAYAKFAWRF